MSSLITAMAASRFGLVAAVAAGIDPGFIVASAASGFDLSDLLTNGTSLVTWLITTMGSFLTFITSNTALLVWFFASLGLLALKCIRAFF